jgi:predicted nucleic acid-binding protein
VTLCDAGPLVAIVDRNDIHHDRCVLTLQRIPVGEMMTTWPCLAEAMYLLGREIGFTAQDALWNYVEDGLVALDTPGDDEWQRMRTLMRKYRDTPMDLADASLVTAAERLGTQRVFTIDNHFRAYRIQGRQAFDLIP